MGLTRSFAEMCKDTPGMIYRDWVEDGIRCLIMRGPGALCAYIGLPENHPLANQRYEDLGLSVHGGLTFSNKGDGKFRPSGYYWYGWDYAHLGDYAFYYDDYSSEFMEHNEHKWTIEEVEVEVKDAVNELKEIIDKVVKGNDFARQLRIEEV